MKALFSAFICFGCLLCLFIDNAKAQTTPTKLANTQIPYLKQVKSHTQLIVDGKPFLMVAGELHNSTSSAPA